jgi:hypothetical protein
MFVLFSISGKTSCGREVWQLAVRKEKTCIQAFVAVTCV